MIGRRDRDDVDRRVFEHLAEIAIVLGFFARERFDLLRTTLADRFIDVDDGDEIAVVHPDELADVLAPAPADADARDFQPVVRACRPFRRVIGSFGGFGPGQRGRSGRQKGLFKKLASCSHRHGGIPFAARSRAEIEAGADCLWEFGRKSASILTPPNGTHQLDDLAHAARTVPCTNSAASRNKQRLSSPSRRRISVSLATGARKSSSTTSSGTPLRR